MSEEEDWNYSQLLPGTEEDAKELERFLGRDYVKIPPTVEELERFWAQWDEHAEWDHYDELFIGE